MKNIVASVQYYFCSVVAEIGFEIQCCPIHQEARKAVGVTEQYFLNILLK